MRDLFNLLLRAFGLTITPNPAPVPGPVTKHDPDPELAVFRADLLARLNMARHAAGLPMLAGNAIADDVAESYAEQMAEDGVLSHAGFADRVHSVHAGSSGGETIAEGQLTPEAVIGAWMADPAHKEILMDSRWVIVGFGRAVDKADGRIFWAADFNDF